MSMSEAVQEDAESMSRQELEEEVKSLRDWRKETSKDMAAMKRMLHVLAGTDDDMDAGLWDAAESIQRIPDGIEEMGELAQSAMAVAKTEAKVEETPTKKEIAKSLTRDEVVVNAAVMAKARGIGAVTCDDVKKMAKPDVRLEHRTILDAWEELKDEWDCFSVVDGEKKKLAVKRENLDDVLVRAVLNDLSDPEVTEALNSYLNKKGA